MSTIAKFLDQPPDQFSTQISSSTLGATDLSVTLDSTSGLPTEGVGQLFKKDANGDLIAGSVEFVHWTNVSGNTLTFSDTSDRGITGSDSGAQSYVADDYFEVWASSYYVGGEGGLIEHNADGTHKTATVTTLKASGAVVDTGTSDITIVTPKAIADSTVTTPTKTQTLTNKRITKRTGTTASSATPTINTDNVDRYTITALAAAITSFTTNLSGTPVDGDSLVIRIKDDGTARAITWGASFASRGATLPTTTTLSKVTYVGFFWNSAASTWDCVAAITEA